MTQMTRIVVFKYEIQKLLFSRNIIISFPTPRPKCFIPAEAGIHSHSLIIDSGHISGAAAPAEYATLFSSLSLISNLPRTPNGSRLKTCRDDVHGGGGVALTM